MITPQEAHQRTRALVERYLNECEAVTSPISCAP